MLPVVVQVLLYVLDGAGSEGRHPRSDMEALMNELELHDMYLAHKPALMFVNKVDLNNGKLTINDIM
jgi:GTP-binding protein